MSNMSDIYIQYIFFNNLLKIYFFLLYINIDDICVALKNFLWKDNFKSNWIVFMIDWKRTAILWIKSFPNLSRCYRFTTDKC